MKILNTFDRVILMLILVIGGYLRFHNFSEWSLSNDELSALSRLQFDSFNEMIEKGVKLDDMHPPGVQAFLYYYTKIVGTSVFAIRLPFVYAGVLSIWFFFMIAIRWLNKNGALAATALFSTLIFPILYSQLARPYSPGLFFTLLNVYFLSLLLYNDDHTKNKRLNLKWFIGYIISGALCMYMHYFAFLFAGIAGLTGLFIADKNIRRYLLLAGILMFILYIPALPVFLYQINVGGLGGEGGWLGPPKTTAFITYLYFIFNESKLLIVLASLIFIAFLIINIKYKTSGRNRLLSLTYFLLPFLIAYLYSIWKNPVYQHSIMLFSFPYLLLFIFSYTPDDNFSIARFIAPLLLAATLFSTIYEKKFYSTYYFGVFKELTVNAERNASELGISNITFAANVIKPFYINYYHKENGSSVPYSLYSCNTAEGLKDLILLSDKSETDYFSYAWSNTYNPPETDLIIRMHYPYLIQKNNYFNSGYRLYSKIKTDSSIRTLLYSGKYDFEQPALENDTALWNDSIFHSGTKSLLFTPENEFGPAIRLTPEAAKLEPGTSIVFSAWIHADSIQADGNLVIQIENNGDNNIWRGAGVKENITTYNKWSPLFVSATIERPVLPGAKISAYFWNSGKKKLYIDDFYIEVIRN